MIDLDDERLIAAGDPGGMLAVVSALPHHCLDGYRLGRGVRAPATAEEVTSIAFCGMGGSAVAGDLLRAVFADHLAVPVVVVRSSELPAFCGPRTLVFVSSYSGETAEALECLRAALARDCPVVVVTSGGRLASRAEELGLPRVGLPAGFMPRAALGYMGLGAIGALETLGLLPSLDRNVHTSIEELSNLVTTCVAASPASVNPAKRLALAALERVPVVWGAEGIGSVAAARWRTQFNENAKVPAWSSSLPEVDHNEVVGWSDGAGARFLVIVLRHDGEPPDVAARFPLSIDIARSSGARVEEFWASGDSALARFLSLSLVGDFTSTYLAIARGVDPTPVEAIARLKRALAEA